MARIGMFCLPWIGHLNPLAGLATGLIDRGHEVVFFHVPDFVDKVRLRGFRCDVFGKRTCPAGTMMERIAELGRTEHFEVTRGSLDLLRLQSEALFAEARPVIEMAKLDLWVVDHLDYAASTLAAYIKAPFVTVIVGLMRHEEEGVPGFSGEPYSSDPDVQERDRRFRKALLETSKPFRDFIEAFRLKVGLGLFSYDNLWSRLAQITQQPAEFEFPRRQLPACFHFTGPFALRANRPPAPFPWERLSGKPLIYASLGTVTNRNWRLYTAIAEATADLDVQVVLSLGGTEALELPRALPGSPLVVSFAPQLAILERAVLAVTHAGMNSTLECLAAGVPMVAIPIANDQFGISARIEWTGTGLRIPATEVEPARLGQAIKTVLNDESFGRSARQFREIIAEADGLRHAVDIIERVAVTGQPVVRGEGTTERLGQRPNHSFE
jgi:zeaxanthin glucosyltransferase